MKIIVFGVLIDVIGKSCFEITALKDSDTLLQTLHLSYPFLKNYAFQLAVNKEIIRSNKKLNALDEIVLLPPYSGG